MATRIWAFAPMTPDSLWRDSAKWANALNEFLNFTDEGLDISANTGDIGTITTALLQGAELTIDLNATGTDPVLLHDAFSLKADGSLTLGGNATISGPALTINLAATGADPVLQHDSFVLYGNGTLALGSDATISGPNLLIDLAATGTDPVLQHAAFALYGDGSAEFSGELSAVTIASGSGITFDNSGGGQGSISLGVGNTDILTFTSGGASVVTGKLLLSSYVSLTGDDVFITASTDDVIIDAGDDISISATDSIALSGVTVFIGTIDYMTVDTGAADSGGVGYKVLRVPN